MTELEWRKELALHTVTVSIQEDVSVDESVQVNDAGALPLFILPISSAPSCSRAEQFLHPVWSRSGSTNDKVDAHSAWDHAIR